MSSTVSLYFRVAKIHIRYDTEWTVSLVTADDHFNVRQGFFVCIFYLNIFYFISHEKELGRAMS